MNGAGYRFKRLSKLITRAELAKKVGCHISTIDALEGGHHVPRKVKRRVNEILKVENENH